MSGLSLLARVVCVFALLAITLWALRRTDGRRRSKGVQRTAELQVVGSARLGKGAALTVVRVGDAEYVLGVTEQSVTLLTAESGKPAAVEAEPVALPAAPAQLPVPARPDARRAVTDQLLGRRPAAREGVLTPPTTAAFLRDAYRVARGRNADSTDLSAAAVATALAGVRGETATARAETLEPAAPAAEALVTPRSQPAARAADGSAARTSSRHALRRDVARTDALRDEEHPWTRACRPAPRKRVDGSGLL